MVKAGMILGDYWCPPSQNIHHRDGEFRRGEFQIDTQSSEREALGNFAYRAGAVRRGVFPVWEVESLP